jgi:hypothetical protein
MRCEVPGCESVAEGGWCSPIEDEKRRISLCREHRLVLIENAPSSPARKKIAALLKIKPTKTKKRAM